MSFHKKTILLLLILLTLGNTALGREPFFKPKPPLEAYDFPKAADAIKLRGLLITATQFRAVVFITSMGGFRVVSPMDRIEVLMDDLRHEFVITGMGSRRLILRGADDMSYEIGVEERD